MSPFVRGSNPRSPTTIILGQLLAFSKELNVVEGANILEARAESLGILLLGFLQK